MAGARLRTRSFLYRATRLTAGGTRRRRRRAPFHEDIPPRGAAIRLPCLPPHPTYQLDAYTTLMSALARRGGMAILKTANGAGHALPHLPSPHLDYMPCYPARHCANMPLHSSPAHAPAAQLLPAPALLLP